MEKKNKNSHETSKKKITGHNLVMILGNSPKLNKKDSFIVRKESGDTVNIGDTYTIKIKLLSEPDDSSYFCYRVPVPLSDTGEVNVQCPLAKKQSFWLDFKMDNEGIYKYELFYERTFAQKYVYGYLDTIYVKDSTIQE